MGSPRFRCIYEWRRCIHRWLYPFFSALTLLARRILLEFVKRLVRILICTLRRHLTRGIMDCVYTSLALSYCGYLLSRVSYPFHRQIEKILSLLLYIDCVHHFSSLVRCSGNYRRANLSYFSLLGLIRWCFRCFSRFHSLFRFDSRPSLMGGVSGSALCPVRLAKPINPHCHVCPHGLFIGQVRLPRTCIVL